MGALKGLTVLLEKVIQSLRLAWPVFLPAIAVVAAYEFLLVPHAPSPLHGTRFGILALALAACAFAFRRLARSCSAATAPSATGQTLPGSRRLDQELAGPLEAINTIGEEQAAMASAQASAIAQIAVTSEQVSHFSEQAAKQADYMVQLAKKSLDVSQEGTLAVEESMAGLEKLVCQVGAIAQSVTLLGEHTLKIGEMTSAVTEQAERSNLLALNASIEAARAGDQGLGFSVIASEMRGLAKKSQQAAAQIRNDLQTIQVGAHQALRDSEEGSKRAQHAVSLAQKAGMSIMGLSEVINEASTVASTIGTSARQQTMGIVEVSAAIRDMHSTIQQAVGGAGRLQETASQLAQAVQSLDLPPAAADAPPSAHDTGSTAAT